MNTETLISKQTKLGRRGFPTGAYFEVTYRCNARCDYCYVEQSTPELPTDDVFLILEKLNASGILDLVLTGGEPFVRKDILRILSKIMQLDFFRFAIMTNAIAITADHRSFLIEHKEEVNGLSVSIFSHDSAINDKIFGIDGALKKALLNCEQFVRAGIPVRAKINILPDNLHTYRETVNMLTDKGIAVDPYPYMGLIPSNKHFQTPEEAISHYKNCLSVLGEDYTTNKKSKTPGKESLCIGIHTKITVNPVGHLRPCIAFKDAFIGSILENRPLNEIVNASDVLKRLKSLKRSDFEQCRKCDYIECCYPCIAHVYNLDKSLKHIPAAYCEQTKCLKTFTRC
ncbi:MAG: radical SAM/SPASM domain-containing protein [Fibrobacterota bacterium]